MTGGIRGWFERRDTYDLLAALVLVACIVLILVNLSMYPVYLDIPYHMAVTSGFREAGGITTWDFWDYSPQGRPQIYPPLLHVIMSLMLDTGMSMELVATLVCLIMFPLIMLSLWWAMRKLFGPRAAFYSLLLVGVPYAFFWQSGVTIAASLVLALTPLVFLALEEDRKVAAVVLLALCLYSHLVLGHLVALSLFIYMLHRRDARKKIIAVLFFAYLLYLPWGINVLSNLSSFSASEPGMGGSFALHLLLWGVAAAGLVLCYLRKKQYYLLPAYLMSMVPIVFFYSNRFWEGHIFLPLAMLGGVALDRLHAFLKRRLSERTSTSAHARVMAAGALTALLLLILCVDPVLASSNRSGLVGAGGVDGMGAAPGTAGGKAPLRQLRALRNDSLNLAMQPTTFLVLLGLETARPNPGSREAVFGEDNRALMVAIEENSDPGDIVYTPDGRLGDLIYAMTGRYSMRGMFHEVQPEEEPDPFTDADLAVIPERRASRIEATLGPGYQGTLEGDGWSEAARVGGYTILVREDAGVTGGDSSRPALPLWAAYALLAAALGAILVDLARKGQRGGPADGFPETYRLDEPPQGGQAGGGSVMALVPACNEEASVGWVVRDIRAAYPWVDVLVVDDGSADGTGEEALKAGAAVLNLAENSGVGEAVRRGLEYAYDKGYGYAVRLDGDGQHPAAYIHRLMLPLYRGEAEVVLGSRFLGDNGIGYEASRPRRAGMAYFRALLRWGTSRRFSDPTSGFRAYSRRAMWFISRVQADRYPEVVSLRLLLTNRFTVCEVPVKMMPRLHGRSSLEGLRGLAMVAGVTWRFLGLPRRRPLSGREAAPAGCEA